jgi:hypothetical protein
VFASLECVARNYAQGSDECKAIEVAAKALFFAFSNKVERDFGNFLEDFHRPLTQRQRDFLKSMNFDLDTEPRD